MKTNEKRNILILIIVSIIIIILENIYMNFNNSNIEKQLSINEKLLGLTDVQGEGIIINIKDGKDLIHQEDIIILLDELKNAGAEAISLNEQRIVNNTYIYCDGSVILIDGVKIGNPFIIKAIGNSQTIYGAITRNKGYITTLTNDGIEVNVEKSNNIEIRKTNKEMMQNIASARNSIKKLKQTNKLIGNSEVIGSGVEITIDTTNTSDITAITFLQLMNDLNSAEAEAISINDNRIVNMTDFMDINKEYILVDSNCISSPYKIKVVGNIQKLKKVISLENSTISKLKKSGKEVKENYKLLIKVPQYSVTRGQNKLIQKFSENING